MRNLNDIGICLVNWNTSDDVGRCLESIKNCGLIAHCVVCDNASSDDSVEMIRRNFPEVKLIASERNLGFGAGNNLCAKNIECRNILILNPDIIITEEAVAVMRESLSEHNDIGAMGAILLNSDGSLQRHMCRKFPGLLQLLLYFTVLKEFFLRWKWLRYRVWEDNTEITHMTDVDQPAGACLIVKRKVFDQIGGFDERFRLFFEDVDLCKKIKNAGFRIVLHPGARVIHTGSTSTKKEYPTRIKLLYFRSGALYFRLHLGYVRAFIYRIVCILDEMAKIILRGFLYFALPHKRTAIKMKLRNSVAFVSAAILAKEEVINP